MRSPTSARSSGPLGPSGPSANCGDAVGRWRVKVCLDNYGRTGVVVITRSRWSRFYQHGLEVARLQLNRDDAEEQLAEARAKATSMARQVDMLEGRL